MYKVVFQFSEGSPEQQKALIRQLNNTLKALSNVTVEVVAHADGIKMMLAGQSVVGNSIAKLATSGVTFLVCRNTLEAKGISEQELLESVSIIPSVVAHLIVRQSEGWAYIKAS